MPPRKGSIIKNPGGGTIALTARVPSDVAAKLDDWAVRTGLGRADIVRLVLSRVTDAVVPPELFAAADAIRDLRRVQ